MGFLLMGLSCGTNEGIQATLYFLIIYIFMNIAFFSVLFLCFYFRMKIYQKQENKVEKLAFYRNYTYITDFNILNTHNLLKF